ncbi:MAG TPA: hypothetical protein VFC17_06350 [Candidatus Limnocylindrales bacterium]|nr:hypothetical protein [Candidatus Limnocylindrales bacterium]
MTSPELTTGENRPVRGVGGSTGYSDGSDPVSHRAMSSVTATERMRQKLFVAALGVSPANR